jgi:hypothetical protein
MPNPSAFILLDEPTELYPTRISEALIGRHRGQPIVTPPTDGGGTNATLMNFAGVPVVIMQFDAPLPDGWQLVATRSKLHWPQAEAVFGRHRGHIRVSLMGDGGNRVQAARVITALIGALIVTHPQCSGVLWDLTVANSSEVVAERSRSAFAPDLGAPSAVWVSLHPFRDPGSPRVGVVTMGLRNFIDREIELEGPQLESVLGTAQGFVGYLLQDGVTVRDGDTIGASATEHIKLHFLNSRRFGFPVIAATLPS